MEYPDYQTRALIEQDKTEEALLRKIADGDWCSINEAGMWPRDKLGRLVDLGLICKEFSDQDPGADHYHYHLTEKGRYLMGLKKAKA